MSRCVEIAQNGLGSTAPNPMVGAVIVHDDTIIGEGFTSAYGGPHAEVNAIQSVADVGLLKDATLYVTLEPCSHFGKTPPCADLIIKHKISNVVVGILDPHEKVAGQGIQKLKDAGCNVTIGVLEKECRAHHKRFLTFHQKKRPYIILKWAETQDGFIAPDTTERKITAEPYWITNTYSRQLVHQWRAEEQAILVGTNTVLEDNPKLDVRHWKGKNPLRVILDKNLKIHQDANVFDQSTSTLVLTENKYSSNYLKNIKYEVLDYSKPLAKQICNALFKYNSTSLIVEGGAQTLQSFIDAGLWDEARIFTGSTFFYKGIKAPVFSGKLIVTRKIGNDTLNSYKK
jgi:diaminohydroxyphosphoribosylaminopyrimidine deaminase/5-amino-6-(5-phosphoribosylamino)uracil reductase